MQYKGLLEHTYYYPLKGKEEAFVSMWKDGASKLAKSMGAFDIGIYWDEKLSAFISTQHWKKETSFQEYTTSEELRSWSEKASKISSKPSLRHLLRVVEEEAA